MKQLIATSLPFILVSTLSAQPNCEQIVQAAFTSEVQGIAVEFTNGTQTQFPNGTTYQWYFGDGGSSENFSPVYEYGQPGTYWVCLYAFVENCVDSACAFVEVGADPCAGLQAGFFPNASPNGVQFSNATTGTGFQTTWQWNFGDGSTSADAQPFHAYGSAGTYWVCLTAISIYEQNGGGVITCVDSICASVIVLGEGSPCDSLNADFSVGVQGSIAFFNNELSSNQFSYHWNFGDGTSGSGPDPVHTYPGPGIYQACLIVWSWNPFTQDTCFADHCTSVVIAGGNAPCDELEAGFFANPFPGGAQFSNATTGTGFQTTWQWNFGDGSTSSAPQPAHEYDQPGAYWVCLTAISSYEQNGGGVITCVDSTCSQVFIPGDGSPCDSLSADFVVTTQNNLAAFNGFGGSAIGYQWTFGDGTSGNGPSQTHVYPGSGTYHACLVTWTWNPFTQDTCYADHCEWITIGEGNPCDSLFACFQWGLQNNVAQFYNCSNSNVPDLDYWWSFGDGTNSDDYQPTHTYPGPGTYTVCLTAYVANSPDSCSHTICNTLVIQGDGSPCDSLSAYFVVTTQENLAAFTSFGGSAIGYQWIFGDGTGGDGPTPTHIYPGPGTYHACLVTWTWDPQTQDTCYAEHCEWITIGEGNPCDSLFACFQWGLQNNVAQFYNCSSSNGDVSYWWSFGDGTNSDAYQPAHTYPGPGTYIVCLTVSATNSPDSCSSTICNTLVIQGDGSPCDSLSADFVVTTQENLAAFFGFGGSAIGYHWTFGDGTTGDGPAPTHIYPGPGIYHACLVTWTWNPFTQDTCYADHCEWITLGGSEPCDGLQAGFQAMLGDVTVWFSNMTVGTGFQTTWHWDFGDGTTSDDAQPSHIFPGLGSYEVCLTVNTIFELQGGDTITCQDSYCQLVTTGVGSPCDSLSAYFVVSGIETQAVFTSFGGTAIGYLWTFGDGDEGAGANPVHTYPGPGTYHACLVTWTWDPQTQDTCYAEHCEWITIGGLEPCDNLQAGFQAIVGDATVWFSNMTVGTGFQTTWHWDFGDGTTSDDAQPSHIFPGLGTYEVCLTVNTIFELQGGDTISCQDSYCQLVTTGSSPCDSLQAQFVWETTGQGVVLFTNTSFTNGQDVSYFWDFGDGTFGDGQDPVHTFLEPGQYEVCLTITTLNTPDSCTSTVCQLVTIQGGGSPCEALNAEFDASVSGLTVALQAGFNPPGTTFEWFFGDGSFGDGANTTHTYPGPGVYNVCLIVGNYDELTQDSCFEDHCMTIVLVPGGSPCDSLWSAEFEIGQQGNVFTFYNTSNTQGTEVSTWWSFGDGTFDDGSQIVHTYATSGEYTVCMTITGLVPGTDDTCQVEVCQNIEVVVGISDVADMEPVVLWPQPFDQQLWLEGNGLRTSTRCTLFDMTGRVVDDRYPRMQGLIVLDYGQLPAGTYLLQLRDEAGDRSFRVMKR